LRIVRWLHFGGFALNFRWSCLYLRSIGLGRVGRVVGHVMSLVGRVQVMLVVSIRVIDFFVLLQVLIVVAHGVVVNC